MTRGSKNDQVAIYRMQSVRYFEKEISGYYMPQDNVL